MTAASAPGKIITFYSYKGGTGRSMALANVAWVLASSGRRVLAVDWDLEAPGLHRYFYPFLVDKELTSSEGIIELMINFQCEALTPVEEGQTLDKDWYEPHADILPYVASLKWEFPGKGTLDFIPAGQQDDTYSSRVTSFNWQNFYDRLGGGVFLEAVKARMREEYDYILIDSRTGVSDASGICTVQMPDTLVACFTLNHQSIEGAAAVAASVYEQRRRVEPVVQIFPVPMRIETGEKEKLELRREYAREHFKHFPTHILHEQLDDYWGGVEVMYVPYYAYEETLAAFGDKRGQNISLLASVERLTAYLTQEDAQGVVTSLNAPPEAERQRILAEYGRKSFVVARTEEQLKSEDEEYLGAAENVFASFAPEQQAIAVRVFTRLVRVSPPEEVGGDTRLRVKRSDLGEDVRPILDELVYRRLVLLGQDEATKEATVELARDALVQRWKRIQDWLAEDHDFLVWRQGLQPGIAKWESTGRDENALLQGAFLAEAERYWATRAQDLASDEREFIEESVRAEAARQEADKQLREKEAQARLETVEVRKEKKQLGFKVAVATVTLMLALLGFYQIIFYRQRTLIYLGWLPPRYTGVFYESFMMSRDGKPDGSLWDYPTQGQWTIGRGESEDERDGALLVSGRSVGVLNIKPAALYDFAADFKLRIVKGNKAAWMFRSQPDKQRGYVFVLEQDKEGSSLVLNGYIYSGTGQPEPLDKKGAHVVPFRACCKDDDDFVIHAEIEGNEFKFWVTVENIKYVRHGDQFEVFPEERSDTGVKYLVEPFKDNRSLFSHGSVGLFEPDDSQMRVESIQVSPSPTE